MNKEEAVSILKKYCEEGQSKAMFPIRDARMLYDAVKYLDPKVPLADKPLFDVHSSHREDVAIQLLLQGALKVKGNTPLLQSVMTVFVNDRKQRLKLEELKKKIAARKILRYLKRRFENGKALHDYLWSPGGVMMNRTYDAMIY